MQRLIARTGAVATVAIAAAGCAQQPKVAPLMNVSYTTADRDCLARAMYFESNRTGEDGMLAVGTVVENRLKSGRYGSTVCGVVGQERQFAKGLMTRPMEGEAAERASRVAEDVLKGKRHPGVREAMFFHTAGYRFHYPNMRYVLVAGGNAFYEKREVDSPDQARENARTRALAIAYARIDPAGGAKPIMLASNDMTPIQARPQVQTTVATTATVTTTASTAARPAPMVAQPTAPVQVAAANIPATRVIQPSAPVYAASAPMPAARPAEAGARTVQPNAAPMLVASTPVAPMAQRTEVTLPTPRPAARPAEPALASVAKPVEVASAKPARRVIQPGAEPAFASAVPVSKPRPAAAPKAEPKPEVVAERPEVVTAPSPVAAAFAAFPSMGSSSNGNAQAYADSYGFR